MRLSISVRVRGGGGGHVGGLGIAHVFVGGYLGAGVWLCGVCLECIAVWCDGGVFRGVLVGLGTGIHRSSVGLSPWPCKGGNVRFWLCLGGLQCTGSIGSRLHSSW